MTTPVAHCVTCMCYDCKADRFPRPSCFQIPTIYKGEGLDYFQICEDCIERLAKEKMEGAFIPSMFKFKHTNTKEGEA